MVNKNKGKFRLLNANLKEWDFSSFGNLEKKKTEVLEKLQEMDREAEKKELPRGLSNHRNWWCSEKEEIFWRQESRCLWLNQGDRLTVKQNFSKNDQYA